MSEYKKARERLVDAIESSIKYHKQLKYISFKDIDKIMALGLYICSFDYYKVDLAYDNKNERAFYEAEEQLISSLKQELIRIKEEPEIERCKIKKKPGGYLFYNRWGYLFYKRRFSIPMPLESAKSDTEYLGCENNQGKRLALEEAIEGNIVLFRKEI